MHEQFTFLSAHSFLQIRLWTAGKPEEFLCAANISWDVTDGFKLIFNFIMQNPWL